jgi:hypothetical protein
MRGKGFLRRLGDHVRGNTVGYVALFVALCGTAYASGGGPLFDEEGSVTSFNVRDKSVRPADFSTRLRGRLVLTSPTSQQPTPGTYIGLDQNSSIRVTVVWGGKNPVIPAQVRFDGPVYDCVYKTPSNADFVNLGGGLFGYSATGDPDVHIELSYYTENTTILRSASILSAVRPPCFLDPAFLALQ